MKYKKNQYTDGVSICASIFGSLFLYWGISSLIDRSWVWGVIASLIGIAILSGQIAAFANRSRLRKAVKFEFESNPETSIENISATTGITQKDVQAIVLDLKVRGELRGNFSTSTGKNQAPVKEKVDGEKVTFYCHNCGTPIKRGETQFCAYCGAKTSD
ncbi:MAG: hypothetical protein JW891_13710 [Candidatus Lokiarchaeota archaeon]|nr:hypothetical protein [Candidatus Lokiarchaeota archaeon]